MEAFSTIFCFFCEVGCDAEKSKASEKPRPCQLLLDSQTEQSRTLHDTIMTVHIKRRMAVEIFSLKFTEILVDAKYIIILKAG